MLDRAGVPIPGTPATSQKYRNVDMSAMGQKQTWRHVSVMSNPPAGAGAAIAWPEGKMPETAAAPTPTAPRNSRRLRSSVDEAGFFSDGFFMRHSPCAVLLRAFQPRRTLAAERSSPTIHFGLGDLARSDQRGDTCVGQPVAMPAHTVFQAPGFETPLATKPAIIVRTMPRITVPCLRYADRANNQCKGNKQYCPIILHEQTLLWNYSRYQTGNRAPLKASVVGASLRV